MSTAVRDLRNSPSADPWRQRVDAGDWDAITAEIDEYGGALLPQLLTAGETARIRALYTDDGLFRSTINMGRHRFGEGEYRYFKAPYPEPVERLKQALYPRLLPIARDWWARLGRPAPWPDTLDEWLRMCHDAVSPSQRPSCCATAGETGTRCTATSTVTSSFPCRSSST